MGVEAAAFPAIPGNLPDDLWVHGLAVQEDFLSAPQLDALRGCARRRLERGGFRAARIGAPAALERRPDLRGDSICWLEEPLFAPELEVWQRLEKLRLQLNREAQLGLFELEMHYACYPPGSGYARHLDQPRGRAERRVAVVLYLNEHWRARDGGQLRMFLADRRPLDVEPIGGRLVLFLTERREHAVLRTRRERLSLTGWFRTRT